MVAASCAVNDGNPTPPEEDAPCQSPTKGSSAINKPFTSTEDNNELHSSGIVEEDPRVTFFGQRIAPEARNFLDVHNGQVCSSWGNFYFKTFDGDMFYYEGKCNYVFASNCKSNFEEFNIQIRRSVVDNIPSISSIDMRINGVSIKLGNGSIIVDDQQVYMPYSVSGIKVDRSGLYIRVVSKLGLELMWNEDDAILLELDDKYANKTCGLCGDFNGIPTYNEFIENSKSEFSFQSLEEIGTNEQSEICQLVLKSSPFSSCNKLVDPTMFIDICAKDLCRCDNSALGFCLCNIFAEYSRQCTHAGGTPGNWRNSKLCPLKCSYNMEYKECGNPCPNSCTNPYRSLVCDNHCIDGCFCPAGTVFDDIHNTGCIPIKQCSCVYNKQIYAPGTGYSAQCRNCTCLGGMWKCDEKSCMGTCSVTGGSHINSFDAKLYSFHGDCSYILTKTCYDNGFSVIGEMRRCGVTATETCLRGIIISLYGGQDFIYIKECGSVYVNSLYTQLPISSSTVTIFKPTSFFIVVQTSFGLQIQIQLVPTMQVFINVNPSYNNTICGLCGNFNGNKEDDFKSQSGVTQGCALSFATTWMVQTGCPVRYSFENPCALSTDNNYTTSCPATMVYSYSVTTCQPTCRSISEPDIICSIAFHPIDGCICPNGTYMNDDGRCVALRDCPCYLRGTAVPAGQSITDNGATCTCQNRVWKCTNQTCPGTCTLYGDGHYNSFDNNVYAFNGDCEYILTQDFCTPNSINNTFNGTFRVITENIPCGSTGTSCSKAIKIFLGGRELVLSEEKLQVVLRNSGPYIPYIVHQMGIYMMIEAQNGLILLWDKKTTVIIKLQPQFQGKVCGLCGNFDGKSNNDFTTLSQAEVKDVVEFANSWKLSLNCNSARTPRDSCSLNPYRRSWSERKCSIITSFTFSSCHSLVEPMPYYQDCVNDACACDTGGDCECFCTAVAAYAHACSEAGVCINWRTPTTCPIFCDFFNLEGECTWHYKPCGLESKCIPIMTCRNLGRKCYENVPGLEGCYPKCPEDKPYFNEDTMTCVLECGYCYENESRYQVGEPMPLDDPTAICREW
ncbi:mucin-5AC-like [Rhinophrynus dorsalis]